METKLINYRSDFKIIEKTERGYDVPFEFRFFTRSPRLGYTASFDGYKYTNCHINEDGSLCIAFDNHCLEIGELKVERHFYLTDKCYPSGICDEYIAPQNVIIDDVKEYEIKPTQESQYINRETPPVFEIFNSYRLSQQLKKGDVLNVTENNLYAQAICDENGHKLTETLSYTAEADKTVYIHIKRPVSGTSIDKIKYIITKPNYYKIELSYSGDESLTAVSRVASYYQKGDKGEKGDTGTAATITVGRVTQGTTASVTNSGTSGAAVLDFVLQKGDKGDKGDPGECSIIAAEINDNGELVITENNDGTVDFALSGNDLVITI